MKKLISSPTKFPTVWLFSSALFAVMLMLNACQKTGVELSDEDSLSEARKPPPPPPPTPANSAIVFNKDTSFQVKGQTRSFQGIYVMDADGSHRKLIYHDYITSGSSWSIGSASDPDWSGNGQQICFAGRVHTSSVPPIRPMSGYTSIFTLNFSLVNGVPTASGVTKILDGAADQVTYGSPTWSPVANEIAVHSYGVDDIHKIQIVPSTGGPLVTVFSAPYGFGVSTPVFSPDGSKIAFHMRDFQTDDKWIKVVDKSTGAVLNSIALDPTLGWSRMDWSRTPGSTILTFRAAIPNSGGQGSLYTLDFSTSSTPTPVATNATNPSFSPDDTKIVYSESTVQQGDIKILTLANNTITSLSTTGYGLNWKR